MSQTERARRFHDLHQPGNPLILYNAWDAGSARAVAAAGASAIATGSWSVAAAHGYDDGEKLPLELALTNLERIVAAVELPVSLDFEGGYGAEPEALGTNVARALARGAVGFNLEDRVIDGEGLYTVEAQSARLAAARAAAEQVGIDAYINARTDLFLKSEPARHDDALLDQALERARAYAEAGASGLFVPGLVDEALIERLCRSTPLPVNIYVQPTTPPARRLAELGVARISHGPGPYRLAMKKLEEAARAALSALADEA
jgi:2-methylisocitrate lyase-like PEP mutase family enzyme